MPQDSWFSLEYNFRRVSQSAGIFPAPHRFPFQNKEVNWIALVLNVKRLWSQIYNTQTRPKPESLNKTSIFSSWIMYVVFLLCKFPLFSFLQINSWIYCLEWKKYKRNRSVQKIKFNPSSDLGEGGGCNDYRHIKLNVCQNAWINILIENLWR